MRQLVLLVPAKVTLACCGVRETSDRACQVARVQPVSVRTARTHVSHGQGGDPAWPQLLPERRALQHPVCTASPALTHAS